MFTKEDAEKKIFDVFYAVGLDKIKNTKPTGAKIEHFEAQDGNEHSWRLKEDKISIVMWATNFEEGTRYLSGIFAAQGAFNDKQDKFVKFFALFCLGLLIETFGAIPLTMFLLKRSIYGGIVMVMVAIGFYIFFIYLSTNWKKRAQAHLLNNFKKIDYEYSKSEIKKFTGLIGKNMILIMLFILSGFMHLILVIYLISSF